MKTQAKQLREERDLAVRLLIVELERKPRNKGKMIQARTRLMFTDSRVDAFLTKFEKGFRS